MKLLKKCNLVITLLSVATTITIANAQSIDVGNGRTVDLGYKTADDQRLRVTAYLPQSSSATPLVVYTHGGGWAVGDRDEVVRNGSIRTVVQALVDRGIAVASVQYRFAADQGVVMRDCIADVKDAIRFMNKNKSYYNIDPNNIATFGQSAGGHIASVVALSPPTLSQFEGSSSLSSYSDFKMSGCVNWYGPSTFRTEHLNVWTDLTTTYSERVLNNFIYDSDEAGGDYERILVSPYTYMSAGSVPLAIYHGSDDGTIPVEGSRLMRDRANAVGNSDFRYTEISGAGHNLGTRTSLTITETIDLLSGYLGVSANSGSNGRYEAEDASISKGAVKSRTDASGGRYVDGAGGFNLTFNVNSTGGSKDLKFRIRVPSGRRSMGVYVNGSKKGTVTTSLTTWNNKPVTATLNSGNNVIELRDSQNTAELDVDYLTVE